MQSKAKDDFPFLHFSFSRYNCLRIYNYKPSVGLDSVGVTHYAYILIWNAHNRSHIHTRTHSHTHIQTSYITR